MRTWWTKDEIVGIYSSVRTWGDVERRRNTLIRRRKANKAAKLARRRNR